jgi:hypothetical protein
VSDGWPGQGTTLARVYSYEWCRLMIYRSAPAQGPQNRKSAVGRPLIAPGWVAELDTLGSIDVKGVCNPRITVVESC